MSAFTSIEPATESLKAVETPDALAPVFKACGDSLRLEILRVLRRDTFGVLELSQIFDMRQSGMSHHLKVLSTAGLLEPQREGNAIFYRRPLRLDRGLVQDKTIRQVLETLDEMELPERLQLRIESIRKQRAEQSQAFFARQADKFREQQELIAEFELYADPVAALIRRRQPRGGWRQCLEIGPGEGAFLAVLAELCPTVTGLDNSPDMLAKARLFCAQRALKGVELVEGDTDDLLDRGDSFELVVANMVLHHVASPADIFLDAAAMMNPGGCLMISDLCRHDQPWTKEACGDLWLGFEPETLTAWASAAGLHDGECIFIGLRNGFQIQVREFWKGTPPPLS